ncbi:hypothetical protein B0H14DRAFT_184627 [Mycena olivaceomarginata]|nr:hypothetical protein B0H14DRAFT_184627 [Mycena olivaceomarginata]
MTRTRTRKQKTRMGSQRFRSTALPELPRAPRRPVIHGLQLASCKHSFCGACLAHHIYRCLNLVFDTARYGTVVKTPAACYAWPPRGVSYIMSSTQTRPSVGYIKAFFFQTCQVKPGEQPVEISDMTARLVLGEANMDEWNHARFLSTLNLIYCPHKGCDETFDADDVAPAPGGITLVRCPRCRGSLCQSLQVRLARKPDLRAIPDVADHRTRAGGRGVCDSGGTGEVEAVSEVLSHGRAQVRMQPHHLHLQSPFLLHVRC